MEHVTLADSEADERDSQKENERSQKENERSPKENEKEDKEIEAYDKDFVHALHGISIYEQYSKRWNLAHSHGLSNYIIEIQVPPPQFS
jgi:hypothetical protein